MGRCLIYPDGCFKQPDVYALYYINPDGLIDKVPTSTYVSTNNALYLQQLSNIDSSSVGGPQPTADVPEDLVGF
ncbi:hypothetical protein TWF506_003993 [Arthrobotrys conoides]|uniref:Uncharacterized protein n=1 Tax=Arthrobotrys conoides TaxID=74498 RepID=A0AAN8N327_9PEZI